MLTLNISERRAYQVLAQHRSTQRKVPWGRNDEESLTADLVACLHGNGAVAADTGLVFWDTGRLAPDGVYAPAPRAAPVVQRGSDHFIGAHAALNGPLPDGPVSLNLVEVSNSVAAGLAFPTCHAVEPAPANYDRATRRAKAAAWIHARPPGTLGQGHASADRIEHALPLT